MSVSRRRLGAAIVAAVVVVGASRPAAASVLVVTDLGDSGAPGQLRTLITVAAAGDTIVLPAGTITISGGPGDDANLTGDLDIRRPLTIVGAGAALTTIQIARTDRLIDVHASGHLVLAGVRLSGGSVDPATAGGGAIRNRGQARVVLSVIENSASGGGGGIMNESAGTLVVESTTLRGNLSTGLSGAGGAILNFGVVEISDSTLSGNKASGTSSSNNGGGFENIGVAVLTNVTISGNTTSGRGGGLFQGFAAGKLKLRNVTIANNKASIAGGGLQDMGGSAHTELLNTIVAGNVAGSSNDCDGTVISNGYNLFEDVTGCTIGGDPTGNIFGLSPLLLPLADNGGPTATMALAVPSPAIDSGTNVACPVTDQRGVRRPRHGGVALVCDMGAVER